MLSVSRVGRESTKWMKEPESALGQPNGFSESVFVGKAANQTDENLCPAPMSADVS